MTKGTEGLKPGAMALWVASNASMRAMGAVIRAARRLGDEGLAITLTRARDAWGREIAAHLGARNG